MSAPPPLATQALTVLNLPPGSKRAEAAELLGATAASGEQDLNGLIRATLTAASRSWSAQPAQQSEPAAAVHKRAHQTIAGLTEVLTCAVAGYHRHLHATLTQRDAQRSAFVNDLLTGGGDPGHLAERAQRYGIRLSGSHVVAVASGEGITAQLTNDIDALLAARYGAGNTLTTLRDQRLVCVSAGGLRGLPAELAHHLLAQLGSGGWQVGVGRAHPGVNGIAASLTEALNALEFAARLGFGTPILHAADLLVFPVLLRDRDAITDLVATVLGPLTEARGGPEPYLDTLTVLFGNQGNYTATARQLHLSVRAVTYRLDRIKALTGYHPSEPTQRFTLHTAVLGARLLGWPG
jgi:sugar diacid utilization regulator